MPWSSLASPRQNPFVRVLNVLEHADEADLSQCWLCPFSEVDAFGRVPVVTGFSCGACAHLENVTHELFTRRAGSLRCSFFQWSLMCEPHMTPFTKNIGLSRVFENVSLWWSARGSSILTETCVSRWFLLGALHKQFSLRSSFRTLLIEPCRERAATGTV